MFDSVQVKCFLIMKPDIPITLRDEREKQSSFIEVMNAEKLLWASIQSKGVLHPDVQDLYRKARTGYEKIILNDHEVVDLQDAEYSLWKLHYKHIDEFRKRIRQSSMNDSESTKAGTLQDNISSHVEGFKLFLSEATEFYKELIKRFRRSYGLPERSSSCMMVGSSSFAEPSIVHKCNYASHRFLICLGDLSRYKELCKKPDNQNQKWAVTATYYFESTMVWPYSGNPQNQLALLATYVGDDFLALYHSVRSLAVKEPFPDARDNIMLLFEKNRSSKLCSLSTEAHFDFLNPLKRSSFQTKSHSSSDSSNSSKLEVTEHVPSGKPDLWPLFVRMISFFLVKSSLEDFPYTFASTLSEFEALLSLDDTELKASLEPYEQLDPARKGPYRAIQVVSIFIFVIYNLSKMSEPNHPEEKGNIQLSALTKLAWTSTFTCMGRILERCLKANDYLEHSTLLPAVLVFVEWLADMLDEAEIYSSDEQVSSVRSYFCGTFVDLLNGLDVKESEIKSQTRTALWEDFELRGFEPVTHSQELLDFSTDWENMRKYKDGNLSRAQRILHAAINLSNGSRNWIFYDRSARKFYTTVTEKTSGLRGVAAVESSSTGAMKDNEQDAVSAVEEEEVILFRPITRYNSAPIYTSITSDQMSLGGVSNQTEASDESLRRSSSLFVEHNEAQLDSLDNTFSFRHNKPFKQQESLSKDSDKFAAGPPSLSAWVLNRESLNVEREKGTKNVTKPVLTPIEEIPSSSFANLSVNEATDSSRYVAPVPSAPLLPEDPVWLRQNPLIFSEGHGILGAPPINAFSNYSPAHGRFDHVKPGIPGFVDAYPPVLGMSSSEWLYRYTNNLSLEQGNATRPWLPHQSNNVPGTFGNLHGPVDASRLDLFDSWGTPVASNRMVFLGNPHSNTPLAYGGEEQRSEKRFLGYQRPNLNGCGGAGTELRAEQPPLLQHLKDREWHLQWEAPIRGPPFAGN